MSGSIEQPVSSSDGSGQGWRDKVELTVGVQEGGPDDIRRREKAVLLLVGLVGLMGVVGRTTGWTLGYGIASALALDVAVLWLIGRVAREARKAA